jgi:hypothetical protein
MNGSTVIGSATLPTTAVLAWDVGGVGDMDSDGDQDIVWHNASTGQNAVWFLNQTAYSSSTTFTAGPSLGWHMVSVFDFANDGKYDILWHNDATGATQLWPMNGRSQAGSPIDYQTVADSTWRLAGTGVFRGNGEHDLFWHNSGTDLNAQWFMTGATLTGSTTFATTPAEWQPSAIGKYDADAFDDVVWRTDVVSQAETDLTWSIVGPR